MSEELVKKNNILFSVINVKQNMKDLQLQNIQNQFQQQQQEQKQSQLVQSQIQGQKQQVSQRSTNIIRQDSQQQVSSKGQISSRRYSLEKINQQYQSQDQINRSSHIIQPDLKESLKTKSYQATEKQLLQQKKGVLQVVEQKKKSKTGENFQVQKKDQQRQQEIKVQNDQKGGAIKLTQESQGENSFQRQKNFTENAYSSYKFYRDGDFIQNLQQQKQSLMNEDFQKLQKQQILESLAQRGGGENQVQEERGEFQIKFESLNFKNLSQSQKEQENKRQEESGFDLSVIMEWKQQLRQTIIQHQEQKNNPFLLKERVKKNLEKLDNEAQKIVLEDKKKISKKSVSEKWLPPIEKYKLQEGTEEIKKKNSSQNSQATSHQNSQHQNQAPPNHLYDNNVYINVLHFNKAFIGKGKKLRSYFESHYKQPQHTIKSKAEVVNILGNNKKQINFQILQEFNKLQKIDIINKSTIKAKGVAKNSNTVTTPLQQEIKIQDEVTVPREYDSTQINPLTFKENNEFFLKRIRKDKQVKERIIWALKTQENLFDIDSLFLFYKVLVLRNAQIEEKLTFLAKFIKYNTPFLTYKDILDLYLGLTEHIDKQNMIEIQSQRLSFVQTKKMAEQIYDRMIACKIDVQSEQGLRLREIEELFKIGVLEIEETLNYMMEINHK